MRITLLILTIIAIFACDQSLQSQENSMFDGRLIGKWQSDKEQTYEWLRGARNFDDARLKKLEKLYGKLVLEFTPEKVISYFEDTVDEQPLKIIGIESDTIAFVAKDPLTNENEIRLILIENDSTFSTYQDDFHIREYFRRIK